MMKFDFIKAGIIATAMTATSIAPSFALGGDNPIEGIDIIIKRDPSQAPIRPFSFGGSSMKKLNSLPFSKRPTFMMQLIANKVEVDKGFVPNGAKALSKWLCEKCENRKRINFKFRSGKTTYSMTMTRSR